MDQKIEKRKKVLSAMFAIYIKKHKKEKEEVNSLKAYAFQRIDKCPNVNDGIYCSSCKIHCFSDDKRKEIKKVMKYSGPRMIFYHPLMALDHMLSGFRAKK